jgi:hypothetical protein
MASNILLLASTLFFLTSQAVSLITDKKHQERKYTNKKRNIPTRKKNIPTRWGIYRQERKIHQQEDNRRMPLHAEEALCPISIPRGSCGVVN